MPLTDEQKHVSQEELQDAWEVIARYLNNHPQLTFFIDPWDGEMNNHYTLTFRDDYGKDHDLVSATTTWKK